MEGSIVTSKGQIVIPAKLRKKYGIKNGTLVRFFETGNEIRIIPVTPEFVRKNSGFLGTGGKLLKSLMEEKKRERDR